MQNSAYNNIFAYQFNWLPGSALQSELMFAIPSAIGFSKLFLNLMEHYPHYCIC